MPNEDILFKNIERRIVDITVQVNHASKKGISNQAKSGYYRFAILLACTIVEGQLFHLVKKYLVKYGGNMGIDIRYKNPHNIPKRYITEGTVICIQEKVEIPLSNQTKFNDLIGWASKKKLISNSGKTKLEKVMRLRNRIHLQSLEVKDSGYTKKKLDDIFNTIAYLAEI